MSGILSALAIVRARPIMDTDDRVTQLLASLQQSMQTVILPMIGDNHFRLIRFHVASQSIYVWDPFGRGCFPQNVMQQMQLVFPYPLCDVDIKLQQDGCNCGFWVVYFNKVFSSLESTCSNHAAMIQSLLSVMRCDCAFETSFGASLRRLYHQTVVRGVRSNTTTTINRERQHNHVTNVSQAPQDEFKRKRAADAQMKRATTDATMHITSSACDHKRSRTHDTVKSCVLCNK